MFVDTVINYEVHINVISQTIKMAYGSLRNRTQNPTELRRNSLKNWSGDSG